MSDDDGGRASTADDRGASADEDDLVAGAVDLHLHCGPSPFDRRADGDALAADAAAAGMDAVVLKEHLLPTAYGVPYVERLLAADGHDVDVFGSVVLNYSNGGFNPFAVGAAIDYGARVVWGPTIDARHHAERTGSLGAFLGKEAGPEYDGEDGITALDDDGTLRPEVRLCVEKVADADVLLCLGHLSFEETRRIVDYAADLGHDRIVVDHPTYDVTDLTLDQQRRLVDAGATLNFPYLAISEPHGWTTPDALYENLREVGIDNCVVSSDVGQAGNPTSPEALRTLGQALRARGLSTAEFRTLVADRPRELLGTD